MFIRPYFRTTNGKRRAYWALVESYRTERGPRQRIVAWLGQLDEAGRLGVREAALQRSGDTQQTLFEEPKPQWVEVDAAAVRVEGCRQFGGPWLALELIRWLGLDDFLRRVMPCGRETVPWSTSALLLIIARLCEPSSELHIAEHFYRKTALPDLLGVPIEKVDDNRLYRALDALLPHKGELEIFLKEKLGELFELEYDVDSVGPSGVRRVELWQTRDAGRTWQPVAVDDDNRSPIIVEPPEEGIYGYRIVVESGNGLTGPPPQSGDVAEIWIGVDWTRPTAELTSAIYGSGQKAGELEVHWQAKDARLARRPVSLLFSDTPGGPWSPIASGLPNNGVYHWRVDSRVPNEIYLRLEVRDEAGNMAAHELQRPIPNDGLVPQGRIRGLHSTEDAPGRGN